MWFPLKRPPRSGSRWTAEHGFTIVEIVVVMVALLVVVGATLTALYQMTRVQSRDQAYGQEIASTQTSFARLIHDLRQATVVESMTGNSIEFEMLQNGTNYNIEYNCAASDPLGGTYNRCAETQAVAPAAPPAAGSTTHSLDILHVKNGGNSYASFCNSAGTAGSGSVFFPENASVANTDGSGLACDESYEFQIADRPTYVQIQVQVPSSGDLSSGGLTHTTVLTSGVYLPNIAYGS